MLWGEDGDELLIRFLPAGRVVVVIVSVLVCIVK